MAKLTQQKGGGIKQWLPLSLSQWPRGCPLCPCVPAHGSHGSMPVFLFMSSGERRGVPEKMGTPATNAPKIFLCLSLSLVVHTSRCWQGRKPGRLLRSFGNNKKMGPGGSENSTLLLWLTPWHVLAPPCHPNPYEVSISGLGMQLRSLFTGRVVRVPQAPGGAQAPSVCGTWDLCQRHGFSAVSDASLD